MDEFRTAQLQLDFRTGRPTSIHGPRFSDSERAACSAINHRRARGILQVSQLSPSRESLSPDVWAAAFIRKTREWDVPLISLSKLGLIQDQDGFFESVSPELLKPLRSGAEAIPYQDETEGIVYKLFDLRSNGSLGKKIAFELNEQGIFELRIEDAVLADTMTKLITLHDAGGHPTEIVGLSDTGSFLIVKQPVAYPYCDFAEDQKAAIQAIKGVPVSCSGIRGEVIMTWVNDHAWLVGDLHKGNVMRDYSDKPTIIDALTGPIPPLAMKHFRQIREAAQDARDLREGRALVKRSLFDNIDDRDL